ncbi:GspE/PulE family protein [Kordia algicida OT-1]|uniref:Type II general secretion pathway (GSP) E protein n=1 Tax=Kordia algicida OT-1 TaxID=391587 RepID=A9EC71_9FLAO|nr:GspE/PulE family protein [Kordia algicida]EDP94447.1 type II general secretion pathway (GSP) E protein [Kordia algicida OT-1]
MEVQDYNIHVSLQQLISSSQAYHYRIVPKENENGIITFLAETTDESLKKELSIVFNQKINLEVTTAETIDKYLATNFRKTTSSKAEALHYTDDFLQKIIMAAKDIGSSDIHFEPYEHSCRIRFRLDGKLKEQYVIPSAEYPVIINKIKIKAQLDISEKRLPQDGRITINNAQGEFDIRVSSLPTLHGEKIVLRILSKDANHINLDELGFSDDELYTYKEIIKKPNGIILISGPTGSGKTTTLYATLKLLNDAETNILTIEDPIEYTLEGINQVQLKENIGLDFSSTLRTFLRQDPDVIMVGEIRDAKTANMAIRAALTGHLVLSTIHTNSAWATISRLIDMDIPPFLIASTLNMSVAQRLVRKLCHHCKKVASIATATLPKDVVLPKHINTHHVAVGCNACYQTGYLGRKAIYEIIPIGTQLINHIKQNETEISDYLKEKNIHTLKDNAITFIENGTTSIEEVYALLSN